MRKTNLVIILTFVLAIPLAFAQDCKLTNLASCIPEKFFEFLLGLINSPLQPFLYQIRNLLAQPVDVSIFASLWAVIVYILSIFYGLFILIAGFNFLISGYCAEKREIAKLWLKNAILMIFFVQASYYLYSILIELSSSLTASIINLIDQKFFLLSIDNFSNIGMQLILAIPYVLTLLLSILLLSLRYLLVAAGILFFPIGLFLYFIPMLQGFGKLIINVLLIIIFLPFIQSLILLASSRVAELSIFSDYKIIIMTASFFLMNLTMILLILFAMLKAALGIIRSDVTRTIRIVR